MINLDAYIVEFITNNYLTIGVVLGILKVIAVETSWAADDKIIQILTGIFIKK